MRLLWDLKLGQYHNQVAWLKLKSIDTTQMRQAIDCSKIAIFKGIYLASHSSAITYRGHAAAASRRFDALPPGSQRPQSLHSPATYGEFTG